MGAWGRQEEPKTTQRDLIFDTGFGSNGMEWNGIGDWGFSKLVTEDVENVLSLALVLWMTEALHSLSQLCLNVRAHFREVGLYGGVLESKDQKR
jgi:hypothetical protein